MARGRRRPELQREGQVRCRFCGSFYDPTLPECPNCGYQTEENQSYTTDWKTISTEDCAGGFGGPKSPIQAVAKWLSILLVGLLVVGVIVSVSKGLSMLGDTAEGAPAASSETKSAQAAASGSTSAAAESKPDHATVDAASGKKEETEENSSQDQEKKDEPDQKSGKVSLSVQDITLLRPGDTYRLEARYGGGYYTWTSSNSAVATVDEGGRVTATGRGTTVITCTGKDDSIATCRLHVTYG